MLTWGILGQLLWTGFAAATYYCLFAVAFALVLKVNKIWNFAQPGVMVFSYYAMLVAFRYWGLPLVPALIFGLLITLAVSLALERYAFMVFRDRNSSILTLFIFAIVFSEFSVYFTELAFGTEPQTLYPSLLWPVDFYAGIAISHWDLMAISVTAVLMLILYLSSSTARATVNILSPSPTTRIWRRYTESAESAPMAFRSQSPRCSSRRACIFSGRKRRCFPPRRCSIF